MATTLALVGLGFALAGVSCAPAARSAPCSNDGDCAEFDEGRAYCVHRRCVECVTSAACGDRKRCAAGECVARGS
jgi:hypothetical protein